MKAHATRWGPVRIGILGASSFAPTTIINPAKENAEVVVAAAASRDQPSADEFAAKYGISKAYGSYEALIDDPDLDAIYVLVPTSMHGRWTKAALAAGKHVLCEKPFTANAAEAREVAELAAKSDRVVMEAIQFRHHPLTRRVEEVIASGELGTLQRVDVSLCVLLPTFKANCYNFALGGGAMMDAGSYVANMARTFGGSTPEVVSAQAKLQKPHVDRAMSAELRYAGATPVDFAAPYGRPTCSGLRRAWSVTPGSCGCSAPRHLTSTHGFRSDLPTAGVWSASRDGPPMPISWTHSPQRCCVGSQYGLRQKTRSRTCLLSTRSTAPRAFRSAKRADPIRVTKLPLGVLDGIWAGNALLSTASIWQGRNKQSSCGRRA